MQDGFTYMFSILVFIFAALLTNLLVAKICDRRRRRSALALQVGVGHSLALRLKRQADVLTWCFLRSQHKQLQDPYKWLCAWTRRVPLCCICLRYTKQFVSATLTGTLTLPLSRTNALCRRQVAESYVCAITSWKHACFALHLTDSFKLQEDCICSSVHPCCKEPFNSRHSFHAAVATGASQPSLFAFSLLKLAYSP